MSGCLIETEVVIGRPPEAVFDYVSQPWRWHEWHPGSRSAQRLEGSLTAGRRFREVAAVRPVAFLPLALRSELSYVVVEHARPRAWEVRGTSPRIDLSIRYELAEDGGTRVRRVFRYDVKGVAALIEPVLLRARMRAQSRVALLRLKRRLESEPGPT